MSMSAKKIATASLALSITLAFLSLSPDAHAAAGLNPRQAPVPAAAPARTQAQASAQAITEARQHAQITTTYGLNPYLRSGEIEVSIADGTATLDGRVDEDVEKELASAIALGVKGISKVENNLRVETRSAANLRGERRYGEVVDDATISAAVRSKLEWSRDAEALQVDVVTRRGVVVLSGRANTTDAKALAGRLASSTRGVVRVDNQLAVQPVAARPAAAQAPGTAISDTWITTKVKYTLLYSSNVAGSDVSVSTKAGVVTLSGTVHSGAERALAIELAQNIRGVLRVEAGELRS